MTKEDIYTMFTEVLADHFDIAGEQVHARARLVADFDLDSLDRIAFSAEIEEKCGIALGENDVRDCETLEDLVDRLAARVAERAI
jgi:acyl carrier protein